MNFKQIRLETEGNVAVLTIQRPEVFNALDDETTDELEQAINHVAASTELRVLVITGSGERAFCAGADLKTVSGLANGPQFTKRALRGQAVNKLIEDLPKPVLIAINGVAFGGGCELAMAGDIRIAASNARFALPEVKWGLMPGFGGTQRLPRLVGPGWAKWLVFSGEELSADEALRLGLVDRVVPGSELMTVTLSMAHTLSARPAVAMAMAKLCLNAAARVSVEEGCKLEAAAEGALWDTPDRVEGLAAFLEKRQPNYNK